MLFSFYGDRLVRCNLACIALSLACISARYSASSKNPTLTLFSSIFGMRGALDTFCGSDFAARLKARRKGASSRLIVLFAAYCGFFVGFHSRARLWASAICWGVILAAIESLVSSALFCWSPLA